MPCSVRAVDRILLVSLFSVIVFSANATADATLAPAPFRLAHLFDRPDWVASPLLPVGVPAHLVDRLER